GVCTASATRPRRPSIVVTERPATTESGSTHENMTTPSTYTVHARHSVLPQPNFVPVMPRWSRSTQSTGVSGAASTSIALPLSSKRVIGPPDAYARSVPDAAGSDRRPGAGGHIRGRSAGSGGGGGAGVRPSPRRGAAQRDPAKCRRAYPPEPLRLQ